MPRDIGWAYAVALALCVVIVLSVLLSAPIITRVFERSADECRRPDSNIDYGRCK